MGNLGALLLKFGLDLISYVFSSIVSALRGLGGDFSKNLHQKGLVGGIFNSLKDTLNGLAEGAIIGGVNFQNTLQS